MRHRCIELSGRDVALGDLRPYADASPPTDVPMEDLVELLVRGARAGWMTVGTWELLREVLAGHIASGADIVITDSEAASPAVPAEPGFPHHVASIPLSTQPPPMTSGFHGRAPRAIVVEDDPGVRGQLVAALSRVGLSCSGYPRPSAALPVLTHLEPHLLLIELDLPEMSGTELLEEARARLGPVRAILFSARLPHNALRGIDGADAVFGQPLTYDEIAARSSRLIVEPPADERSG